MPKFELEKETAKVKFILEKKQIPQLVSEVVAIVDVSGSIKPLFNNGTIQKALQRIVPIALNFDDNGELPVYAFSEDVQEMSEPITSENFETYVKDVMFRNRNSHWWSGTSYAPVIEEVATGLGFYAVKAATVPVAGSFFKRLLGSKEVLTATPSFQKNSTSGYPAIVYFVTDGESNDESDSSYWLKSLADANSQIYFNFIGVGKANFNFLEKVADLYPNVGFARVSDLEAVADSDDIYDYLIPDELTTWLKAFVNVKASSAGVAAGA